MKSWARAASAALIAGVLSVSAACSSSGSDKSGNADANINMGVSAVSLAELPVWVAIAKGYFPKHGIDMHIKTFTSGSATLSALVSGGIDITSGAYSSMLQAAVKKQNVLYIANMRVLPGYALVVSPKSNIKTLADIKGKRIGVSSPGGETYNVLRYVMAKNQVPLNSVTYVAVGLTAGAIAAVESGQVDAAMLEDTAITQAEQRAGNKLTKIFDFRDPTSLQKWIGTDSMISTGIYCHGSWAKSHAETAKHLLAAIVEAEKFIQSSSAAQITSAVASQFKGLDKSTLQTAIEANLKTYSTNGRVTAAQAQTAYDQLQASQPGSGGLDLASTYTDAYLP